MKKIGIITFHNAQNFGAVLQAYALERYLQKSGYDVSIIDYRCKQIESIYKPFYINRSNIKLIVKDSIKNIIFWNKKIKRYKKFNAFINKNYILTKKCQNLNEVELVSKKFDCIIAGSDQIWNYKLTKKLDSVYSLNFETSAKKISYAASFGINHIPEGMESEYFKLKSINSISIREPNCKEQIEKIIDKKVDVVVDPTLLLNKKDWIRELNLNPKKEKYILVFFVDKKKEYVDYVNKLSKLTNLPIIHFEKNNKYKNVLKNAYVSDPKDFVEYIYNAEYVITNSFHGTIFSINLNKNFLTIPNMKTASRIFNILNITGLNNKAIYNINDINKKTILPIDYSEVNKKLKKFIEDSENWLKNELK